MTFVAGALLGVVVGFGVAMLVARRTFGVPIPVVIAALALVVASLVLARRDSHRHRSAVSTTSTTSTTPAHSTSTTTPATEPQANVNVPNVVGESRESAVAALTKLGLHASINPLPLVNVPSGFVLSQTPITASVVAPGTTVSLVVSAAT